MTKGNTSNTWLTRSTVVYSSGSPPLKQTEFIRQVFSSNHGQNGLVTFHRHLHLSINVQTDETMHKMTIFIGGTYVIGYLPRTRRPPCPEPSGGLPGAPRVLDLEDVLSAILVAQTLRRHGTAACTRTQLSTSVILFFSCVIPLTKRNVTVNK
jgi:hypothetical protein